MTEKALKYKMPGEDKHLQLSNQALKYESATITFLNTFYEKKTKRKASSVHGRSYIKKLIKKI